MGGAVSDSLTCAFIPVLQVSDYSSCAFAQATHEMPEFARLVRRYLTRILAH